jgi:signal peptidase I
MEADKPSPELQSWWMRILFGRRPRRTLVRLVVLVVASVVIFRFVLVPIRIAGISMEPTYHDGRVNFVNRLAYVWNKPRRGDVVAIKTTGMHIMYMKRIVGLPGETISIEKGMVMVNGQPMDEPYVVKREPWNESPVRLESGQYLVIGDNRATDRFTHMHGTVNERKIAGKVLW